jgi:transcription-repair coupling factor (superfamily II helicase)
MDRLKQKIFQSDQFSRLADEIRQLKIGNSLSVKGIAGSLLAFLSVMSFESVRKQILLIAYDEDRAEKLRDDCALIAGEQHVLYFCARPTHQAQTLDLTSSISQIETLKALSAQNKYIIIASPNSIIEKIPAPKHFTNAIIELEINQDYNFQKLIEQLEEKGFQRKNFIETYDDFAVRGGIIDIFSHVGENPIRFEFWGNTIESIREFDVLSQRSIRELKSASIVPDLSISGDKTQSNQASLFDYLNQDAVIILDEPALIEKEISEIHGDELKDALSYEELIRLIEKFPSISNSTIQIKRSETVIDFSSNNLPRLNGSVNLLVEQLVKYSQDGYSIYLSSDTKEESERLKELINEVVPTLKMPDTFFDEIVFLTETVHSGFIFHPMKLVVFTEHEIFGRLKRRGTVRRRKFKGFSQKELHQLKQGDYVVHVDHGIGEFVGLTKIKIGGIEQEAVKLLFLEEDVLYVNLNFVNRIQKYSSQEGHVPKLNKLGSADWEKAKARAKKRIKDIARDLIWLYAKRKKEKGTAFSSDSHWQKELEASFMYEDTIDQATATLEVKRDMENPSPMDRLICGDVGFGKTEVAVRAAFKSVMDGKQVAILVPTTILAIQHYNTFLDRLNRYTTRVENITRFKSKKDQKRIVDEMKKGSIDIIIGTHRLLSKDIEFKDLGLLIIDEEHRFGVSAKEKLRQLKASVDTLSLTATPIPRTLHFSLIGARDLSLINTPPRNRLPIITEIIPGSEGRQNQWNVVREAVLKELHRSGQIYFVHDRVQNIDVIAEQLKSYVPEARVHVAHGQMSGHQLEKTMMDFLEKKYDVIVATKIIESGLDIPNVNTIIINRADRFGLAELYQLRGRVGRSNVQAYAYLLVPPVSVMPKQTLRRIQAIEEFTELGSGFNLAMRDLEIRGAGNLLGAEQSGFIIEMGFEMYERVVRETVEELKQQEFSEIFAGKQSLSVKQPRLIDTIIDADVEALIPDFYIESDSERLDIYRRLYKAITEEELKGMRVELHDRFGEYPEEVENLFQLVEMRLFASQAGFPKVSIKGRMLSISLPPDTNEQFYGKDANAESTFQKIMKNISEKKIKDVQLRQVGRELMIQYTISEQKISIEKIEEVKQKIIEVTSSGK